MRFGGRKLEIPITTVTLRAGADEPIQVVVQGRPPGIEERADRLFPIPPPPRDFAKVSGSGKVMKDMVGRPIEIDKTDDEEWRRRREQALAMHGIMYLEYALRVDPDITWEAAKRNGEADAEYYQKIRLEVEQSGLTDGEVLILIRKSSELTLKGEEEIREKAESFLGGTRTDEHGATVDAPEGDGEEPEVP